MEILYFYENTIFLWKHCLSYGNTVFLMETLSFFVDSRACGRAAGLRQGLRQGCGRAAGLRQGCSKVAAGPPGVPALGLGQAGPGQTKPPDEPRLTGRPEQDLG